MLTALNSVPASTGGIQSCPLPERLYVPLLRRGRPGALACVQSGDRVTAGEVIGRRVHPAGIDVLAPADGDVEGLVELPSMRAPQSLQPCIVIRVDPHSPRAVLPAWKDWSERPTEALRARLCEAGLDGPWSTALSPGGTLLLDGREPQHGIDRHHLLLTHCLEAVCEGARLIARILDAHRIVLRLDTAHLESLRTRLDGSGLDLVEARAAADAVTGPIQQIEMDLAHAAWQAVVCGHSATHRLVRITGARSASPMLFEVAIGTPIGHLIDVAGGYPPHTTRLLGGGWLDGLPLPNDAIPVDHDTRALLIPPAHSAPVPNEAPCIRCGDCATACPASLRPWRLLEAIDRDDRTALMDEGLADCTVCGLCTPHCPSRIPLLERLAQARESFDRQQSQRLLADAARERHLARQNRQRRVQEEHQITQSTRKEAASSSAVLAAIARAKARRDNTGNPP